MEKMLMTAILRRCASGVTPFSAEARELSNSRANLSTDEGKLSILEQQEERRRGGGVVFIIVYSIRY